MRKRKNSNRLQSNKGFTLVEVLVAIAVLSIILVPLLSAFVVSANTNAKARQTLRATTLAQNVMEELKAYSLEDSANQYNGTAAGNSVISKAMASYETVQYNDGVHKAVTVDADDQVQGRVAGRYDFVLKGVSQESAKFDVEVHVRKPEVKNPALSGLGSFEMVNITSMNRNDCAYFAQEPTAHSIVAAEYARRREIYANAADMSASQFLELMSRTITVDVNSAADGSETVKVTYDYHIPDGYVSADNRNYTEYTTIFDNYSSQKELKAVYIYYYPLYDVISRDQFVINNYGDADVAVYLIRMKDSTYNFSVETDYKPVLKVYETQARVDNISNVNTSNVKICSNINPNNFQKQYSAVGLSASLRVTDLGNAETIHNLYDVTIKVYRHDENAFNDSTGETVITFDDDKKISTFTGTVLDKAD